MSICADLHLHSTASDGTDSPGRVVERAREAGLEAIALTDHDSLDGVSEAQAAGREWGIEVVPGAELTCYSQGREVNILGYGVNPSSPSLLQHCRAFVQARVDRARSIGDKLEALGIPIDMAGVIASCDGGVVARPHVARALVAAGYVQTTQEAFEKYLHNGGPADVPKMQVTTAFCIDLIHGAGGLAVLAHPGLWDQFALARELAGEGLDGIEVWHSAHDDQQTRRAEITADNLGILKTGGSDCHGGGTEHGGLIGKWGLDKARWIRFRERLTQQPLR